MRDSLANSQAKWLVLASCCLLVSVHLVGPSIRAWVRATGPREIMHRLWGKDRKLIRWQEAKQSDHQSWVRVRVPRDMAHRP